MQSKDSCCLGRTEFVCTESESKCSTFWRPPHRERCEITACWIHRSHWNIWAVFRILNWRPNTESAFSSLAKISITQQRPPAKTRSFRRSAAVSIRWALVWTRRSSTITAPVPIQIWTCVHTREIFSRDCSAAFRTRSVRLIRKVRFLWGDFEITLTLMVCCKFWFIQPRFIPNRDLSKQNGENGGIRARK